MTKPATIVLDGLPSVAAVPACTLLPPGKLIPTAPALELELELAELTLLELELDALELATELALELELELVVLELELLTELALELELVTTEVTLELELEWLEVELELVTLDVELDETAATDACVDAAAELSACPAPPQPAARNPAAISASNCCCFIT